MNDHESWDMNVGFPKLLVFPDFFPVFTITILWFFREFSTAYLTVWQHTSTSDRTELANPPSPTPRLPRTESSLHMSCGHLLRRDQLMEHCHAVHNTIMAGVMDGWLIERCPLAGYGCEFYQFRLQPKGRFWSDSVCLFVTFWNDSLKCSISYVCTWNLLLHSCGLSLLFPAKL